MNSRWPSRVGIVGSRDFQNLFHVEDYVHNLFTMDNSAVIISGGARGVDRTAVETAKALGMQYLEFLPDYEQYGRYKAPKVRNLQIVSASRYLVAFWNGVSGGTLDSISHAINQSKMVFIINEEGMQVDVPYERLAYLRTKR